MTPPPAPRHSPRPALREEAKQTLWLLFAGAVIVSPFVLYALGVL